ncbi:MAG: preprotein translocase subunit SecE [Bacillota bacterium]|nr:preprotein translocase subunit SecE [Bacillota bacterium]
MAVKDAVKQAQKDGRKKSSGKLKGFFKGVWAELKKVHWPSKKELATYTGVVLVAVLAMAVAISVFDWVISTVIELALSLV